MCPSPLPARYQVRFRYVDDRLTEHTVATLQGDGEPSKEALAARLSPLIGTPGDPGPYRVLRADRSTLLLSEPRGWVLLHRVVVSLGPHVAILDPPDPMPE